MNSKIGFIPKVLFIGLWIFPGFFVVFGVDMEQTTDVSPKKAWDCADQEQDQSSNKTIKMDQIAVLQCHEQINQETSNILKEKEFETVKLEIENQAAKNHKKNDKILKYRKKALILKKKKIFKRYNCNRKIIEKIKEQKLFKLHEKYFTSEEEQARIKEQKQIADYEKALKENKVLEWLLEKPEHS